MERAGAHATIADVSDGDDLFLLHATGERDAGHDRDHVAEMRDRAEETFREIAEMYVEVAPT